MHITLGQVHHTHTYITLPTRDRSLCNQLRAACGDRDISFHTFFWWSSLPWQQVDYLSKWSFRRVCGGVQLHRPEQLGCVLFHIHQSMWLIKSYHTHNTFSQPTHAYKVVCTTVFSHQDLAVGLRNIYQATCTCRHVCQSFNISSWKREGLATISQRLL